MNFMRRFSSRSACALAALLCCAGAAYAEAAESFEPKPVGKIELLGGSSPTPLQTQKGKPLDAAKLRDDVKTLWRTGRYADVNVETVEHDESVDVIFRLQPKRTLRLRRVEVKPPTPGIELQFKPGAPIDPQAAQQVGESVRKQLESSGHPFVDVEAVIIPVGSAQADLEVRIDQGRHIDIGGVTLAGNLGAPGKDARKALKWTTPKTMIPRLWHIYPGYSDYALQYDAANLRSYYYTRGYFDADVRAGEVDLSKSRAAARFDINVGQRYSIRNFTLLGAAGERSIDAGKGDAFPARAACNALLAERSVAERAGILDFSARIEVRDLFGQQPASGRWADLHATIERGTPYRVGRIEFRGNHSIRDSTIRTAIVLNEADMLDGAVLRKSLQRINSMGFFEPLSQADVVVNTPPGSDRADLTIQLRERKMRHWYLSGPVGPMSVAGPLQLKLGSRLPAWGRGILELSTYTAAFQVMYFAKPLSQILPGFPDKRLLPIFTIQRPMLPGQRIFSGFTIAPQLGWRGMAAGYGISQAHTLLDRVFESPRALTPPLAVTIAHNGREGTLYCEPEKTTGDWMRQIGGFTSKAVFSFVPF